MLVRLEWLVLLVSLDWPGRLRRWLVPQLGLSERCPAPAAPAQEPELCHSSLQRLRPHRLRARRLQEPPDQFAGCAAKAAMDFSHVPHCMSLGLPESWYIHDYFMGIPMK